MKKFTQQLKNLTQDVRMSARERDGMRGYLLDYMEHKPLRAEVSHEQISSMWFVFNARLAVPALVVALIFSLGGGVAFASERALPGDVLYPVKVGVTEEVRAAFAITPEADFEWNVRRAERRLEEAERLAVEGRLSREHSDELEERFEEHASEALLVSESLEAEDEGLSIALNIEMEATLLAHQEILDELVSRREAENGEQTSRLLARVSEKIADVDSARAVIARADIREIREVQTERSFAPNQEDANTNEAENTATMSLMVAPKSESVDSRLVALDEKEGELSIDTLESLRKAAVRRIETLRRIVETQAYDADEHMDSLARVLVIVEERLATGDRHVSDENYREALLMYRDVLQITTRALLFERIGGELRIGFSDEEEGERVRPVQELDENTNSPDDIEVNVNRGGEGSVLEGGVSSRQGTSTGGQLDGKAISPPRENDALPVQIEVDVDKGLIDRIY